MSQKTKRKYQSKMPKGVTWVSPICFNAQSMSKLIHKILDELGYDFETSLSQKAYSSVKVIIPMPQFANIHRFAVKSPSRFFIDLYDTKPSHGGWIYFIEIKGVTQKKKEHIKPILKKVVEATPRPPWQFSWGQKFQHGLLQTEYRQAKKAWARMGFDVKTKKNKD